MQVKLQTLIALWKDSLDLHALSPPASADEIAKAETRLGVRLPEPFRELYRFSNGLSLDNGNLRCFR